MPQGTLKKSRADISRSGRQSCEPELNYTGCETSCLTSQDVRAKVNKPLRDVKHRVQKWNVGPERRKERETFCGRFGKRTPFLRWRAQLQDVRKGVYRR